MTDITTHEMYANRDCRKFVWDMLDAGFEVEHYRGRFYWEGPSVRTGSRGEYPSMQEILRATDVKCQWDQLGLGSIIYPKSSSPLLEKPLEKDDEFDRDYEEVQA